MAKVVPILDIQQDTHDVKRFTLHKPDDYTFTPGQATEVSIDKDGWREEKRPFTFTSLPENENLEFTIKIYQDHGGVTKELDKLETGDRLLIDDPWGTIRYDGSGVFLAGGAGVTPFIAIFRHLYKTEKLSGSKLIFANKSKDDIILRDELHSLLGSNFINVITQTDHDIYVNSELTFLNGFIDKKYLQRVIDHFDQRFYVCGPPPFNKSMIQYLKELGADAAALVFEQ
jgi:ferredoxin-NADP reductase